MCLSNVTPFSLPVNALPSIAHTHAHRTRHAASAHLDRERNFVRPDGWPANSRACARVRLGLDDLVSDPAASSTVCENDVQNGAIRSDAKHGAHHRRVVNGAAQRLCACLPDERAGSLVGDTALDRFTGRS